MLLVALWLSAAPPLDPDPTMASRQPPRFEVPQARALELDSGEFGYAVIGKGAPLLVIPGGPGLGYTYLLDSLVPLLGDRRRLIFYDGRSGAQGRVMPPSELTMDVLVEDLEALRVALRIERLDVLAHSFGGLVALRYALAHPNRVRSLIQVEGDPARRADWERFRINLTERRSAEHAHALAEIDAEPGWREKPAAVERYFRVFLRPYFADPELAERLRFGFDAGSFARRAAISAALRGDLGDWDLTAALAAIDCPVLLIYGDRSLYPRSAMEEMERALPAARLVLMRDVGHFPFLEAADAFRALVLEFLRQVETGEP